MRCCQELLGAIIISTLLLIGCTVEKVPSSSTPSAENNGKPNPSEQGSVSATNTPTGVATVKVPAGEFVMGDDDGEDDERPAHRVQISSFYMDAFEVTQEAYEKLMGVNPAKFKNPKHPVEQLGWFGAIKYCNMRSLKEGLAPCYDLNTLACDFNASGYRLPTEAEWEYACRAQTTSDYSFSGNASKLGESAWFEANAAKTTHPVGVKKPNAWGLYDMHGNVYEWCNDVYSETFYAQSPGQAPCNYGKGEEKVLRGGGWNSPEDVCRSSARYSEAPGLADVCFGYDAYGFRCVKRTAE